MLIIHYIKKQTLLNLFVAIILSIYKIAAKVKT